MVMSDRIRELIKKAGLSDLQIEKLISTAQVELTQESYNIDS